MPEFSSTIQTKIDQLRTASRNFSETVEVYQLLKISWAAPDGVRYYASTLVEAIENNLPVSPVEIRLPAEEYPAYFLPVSGDSTLGDEEIDLKIWDADDEISRLIDLNGEGVKVELLLWFPSADLLLSEWWGHLRTSEDSDVEFWMGKAANGFRSPNLPLPRRAHYRTCQAVFGEMATGCDYDRHKGGNRGNLNGAVPFTSCPKKEFSHCSARLGDNLSHLSHQTVEENIINNQTKGPALLATSRGNETNLKRPVRVIMGTRYVRDLDLMVATPLFNTKDPAKGWWRCKFEIGEGPISQILGANVNGQNCLSGANLIHFGSRLGDFRQPPTGFTPNVHNYSYTAHFDYTYGWVNPSQVQSTSLKAEVLVSGLRDIEIYTAENSSYFGATSNRAWQILRMMTDKRWGYGLDKSRVNILSWLDCAIWGDNLVSYIEPETLEDINHTRSASNVDLVERTTQQQIEDMCWAGRFSRPFLFQGKLHIVPLRQMLFAELFSAPLFSDSGDDRNIIWENDKTTLRHSRRSDEDLPNRIELTYDDEANQNREQILTVEDESLQLRAGAVMGDSTRRVVPKKESAVGVTNRNQAIKLAWSLLDLGKFDEGGLKNNLRIKFKAWFLDCLSLHPEKVIRVLSDKITRYGFEWFRIKKIKRLPNLQVEIEAQAYPREYYDSFEFTLSGPGAGYQWGGYSTYRPLTFGSLVYKDNHLQVEVLQS